MSCAWFKKELKCRSLGLDCDEPRLFATPESNQYQPMYLVWRLAALLCGLCVLVISVLDTRNVYWFLYLSNWAFTSLSIDAAFKLSCGLYHYWLMEKHRAEILVRREVAGARAELPDDQKPVYDNMPLLFKVTWVWQNVAFCAAPVSMIFYWGAVYNSSTDIGFITILMCILNVIYVILDVIVSALPIRILHFIHPLIFVATWCLFTVVYWAAGGTDAEGDRLVYRTLNFSQPDGATYVWIPVLLLLTPIFQSLLYGLYRLRVLLYNKCGCDREVQLHPEVTFTDDVEEEEDSNAALEVNAGLEVMKA